MFSEISTPTLDYHISSREEKYASLKVTLGMFSANQYLQCGQ